jgi:AcrR family transcriptional regulator
MPAMLAPAYDESARPASIAPMTLGPKAPERRRRLIVDAALDVLRERGFAGARMADIAARAGTSPALVAYHFGTLSAVLSEALTVAEDRFYADFAHLLSGKERALEKLWTCIDLAASGGPAIGDWVLWMEVWVQALRDEQVRRTREQLDRRWRRTLLDVIEQGHAEGSFRCPDPAAASFRLASLMDGLAVQLALRDPDMNAARMILLWRRAAALELGIDSVD